MSSIRECRIALIQMSMSEDMHANVEKASSMISRGASKGAEIVCLPELFTRKYFPQKPRARVEPEEISGSTITSLSEVAQQNRTAIICGSIYETFRGNKYNTSVVIDEKGRIAGVYRKVHIPHDECFYEKNYFSSGNEYTIVRLDSCRAGVLICFDQWFPEAARVNALLGAEIIFYPTAIGTVDGIEQSEGNWKDAWICVQRGHAISNSVIVAAVNRTGDEGRMHFWGNSFVCDQFGKILAEADERERILITDVDLSLKRKIEEGWGFMRSREPLTYRRISD